MIKRTQPKPAAPAAAPATIGPFEVAPSLAGPDVTTLADGVVLLEVIALHGVDAYHVSELSRWMNLLGPDSITCAHRTVQRIDLATRLQLPADYDPLDLVGRKFLVEVKS